MGKILSKCPKRKKESRQPSIMYPYPNQHEERNYDVNQNASEGFYMIPNEDSLNKTIEYLDELSILTDTDIQKLDESLIELRTVRKKHKVKRFNLLPDRSDSISKPNFERFSPDNFDGKLRQSSVSSGISLQNIDEAIKKPYLLIEVDSAKFMHEETIIKGNLRTPFVIVKIYRGPSNKVPLFSVSTGDEVKAFITQVSHDKLNPIWKEFIKYELPLECLDEEQWRMFSMGFNLFYIMEENGKNHEIGQEQHISLASLWDQKVQAKVFEFKDPVLKGSLARLQAKFQLIYDENQVKERLVAETETKLERLIRIKEKHMPGFQVRMSTNNTFINSMRNIMDHDQSVQSVYSSGVVDSGYYIAI